MSDNNESMVVEVRYGGLVGRYRGGAYIDVYTDWPDPVKDLIPFHTINVYDYETGKPRIGFDPVEVLREMREYIASGLPSGDTD